MRVSTLLLLAIQTVFARPTKDEGVKDLAEPAMIEATHVTTHKRNANILIAEDQEEQNVTETLLRCLTEDEESPDSEIPVGMAIASDSSQLHETNIQILRTQGTIEQSETKDERNAQSRAGFEQDYQEIVAGERKEMINPPRQAYEPPKMDLLEARPPLASEIAQIRRIMRADRRLRRRLARVAISLLVFIFYTSWWLYEYSK